MIIEKEKLNKLKIPFANRRTGIFSVDPARLALASLLVKGSILLHEIRARVHGLIINKRSPFARTSFTTSSLARNSLRTLPYAIIIHPSKTMSTPLEISL